MILIWPTSLRRASSSAIRPSNKSLSGKPTTNAWIGPMLMKRSSYSAGVHHASSIGQGYRATSPIR